MSYQFGNTHQYGFGNTWHAWVASDQAIYRAYIDGSSHVLVDVLGSQGWTVSSSANVVDNTTGSISSLPLNEEFCLDQITGKLHLLYATLESSGSKPVLYHKSSSNSGVTWSARHTLDDGTIHTTNRFYRVGIVAYNDYLTCVYVSLDGSLFTSDGLYEVHSSDAGATWSAPAKLYTSPVDPDEPNIYLGEDGTAHICWYDPGVLSNTGGDVYYASGAFNGAGWTWAGSASRLTTSELWGRTRIFGSNGILMITGNINWPSGPNIDVGLLRSTNNGSSWSATTTVATHTGSNFTSHPWGDLSSDRGMIVYLENSSPQTYFAIGTTDAGVTWSALPTPFTSGSSSGDAPFLAFTKDTAIAVGFDDSIGVSGGDEIWAPYPLFAPDPAITNLIDQFNRTENPLTDGGKWTQGLDSANSLKTNGTGVTRQLGAGSFDRSCNYRNDFTFSGSCETYLDCVTGSSGGDGSVELSLWTTGQNGYKCTVNQTSGSINFYSGGVYSSTPVDDGVTVLTSNDKYCARLDLNCVVLLRYNNATGKWLEIARWNDTTNRTSLVDEIDITGFNAVPVMDNHGGGQLFAPINVIPPAMTGIVGNGNTLSVNEGTWATGLGKEPTRFSYQWQNSTDGGLTWPDITRAALPFYTIGTANGLYRAKVTATNSMGATIVFTGGQVPYQPWYQLAPLLSQ